jgi:xanthine/CO dehydrogenase XdhC/CoxF family maturation factor
MNNSLLSLYLQERRSERSLVLATVVRTEGPTYTKAGALLIIAGSGEYAGLLSGGCLEGDLAERGRAVFKDGQPRLARYDMHGPDDLLFGLGSGCEGSLEILLQRLDSLGGWEPIARLASAAQEHRSEGVLLVVRSGNSLYPTGSGTFVSDGTTFGGLPPGALGALVQSQRAHGASRFIAQALPGVDVLGFMKAPVIRVALLGAAPDAAPVVELVSLLGWSVTVIDHRPHYAQTQRFPKAQLVLDGGAPALATLLQSGASSPQRFAAAIVMSHHFLSDLRYLAALADSDIPYIGLLGPAVRRDRLLSRLGAQSESLRPRLYSPVGLDLGANTPELIALAIVAEIQGVLAGRDPIRSLSSPIAAASSSSAPRRCASIAQ